MSADDERGDGEADVEGLVARRRAAPRRGTPQGREPIPGRAHTQRLIALTVLLVVASAVVLGVVVLLAP